jgi:hypothetical protein
MRSWKTLLRYYRHRFAVLHVQQGGFQYRGRVTRIQFCEQKGVVRIHTRATARRPIFTHDAWIDLDDQVCEVLIASSVLSFIGGGTFYFTLPSCGHGYLRPESTLLDDT